MEFRLLGPLEVRHDGRELLLRGRKLEALLVLLLLHANETLTREQLVDELWGADPPPTADKSLQVHVSRLRHALGDSDGLIVTRGHGYAIRVEPEQLDLVRFRQLAEAGGQALADGSPEEAARLLREALALWRGEPLADLAGEPFAREAAGRLTEQRLVALEQRIEADLAIGRHREVADELGALVARNPFHERLHELRMLALYRSGRQAEALEAFAQARRALVDELGIEPGDRLRDLQARILAHDRTLEAAARRPRADRAQATAARERRRLVPLAAAAAAALAAVVVAGVVLIGADEAGGLDPLTDDSHAVVAIDPASGEVTDVVPVGSSPGDLAFEPRTRSLWVTNEDDEAVTRIDLEPLAVGRTIPLGDRPEGLAAGDGSVWVAAAPRTRPYVTARRIDARFDRVAGEPLRAESLPEGRASIALGPDALWLAPSFGRLTRLDPRTGRVRGPRVDPGHTPAAIAADARTVWLADGNSGVVTRVEAESGAAEPVPVPGGADDVALGRDAAWVSGNDEVARIDAGTASVRSTTPVGRRPLGIAVGAGSVWVANSGDGTVSRLDEATGRVTDTIAIGASPQDVAVADGRVWVSVRPRIRGDDGAAGGTLRVESYEGIDFADPALAYLPGSWQMLYAACGTLLHYPSVPGDAPSQLAPDLAAARPAVSPDGLTYTFRIRRGFRFSPPSGEPVTARAFKRTIERTLHPRMRSPGAVVLRDVVGVPAYRAGRTRGIAGITASQGTLRIRLRRPAPDLPTRLSLPFFCAVPPGTPIEPEGLVKVPTAGPYYVASHVPDQEVLLRRNPGYAGSRARRPDEIRILNGRDAKGPLGRVERGEVDYAPAGDADAAPRLEARYGPGSEAAKEGRQRFFVHTLPQLDHIVFNTSRGPFRSVRLRRAVNFALDRRALSRSGFFDGLPSQPTDQYIPPTMAGFRDVEIYPFEPDLETARRLAGRKRRTVFLYTLGGPTFARAARIIRANLLQIGLNVQIANQGDKLFVQVQNENEPYDMVLAGWVADRPDPIDFLDQLDSRIESTSGKLNIARFDDPAYDRRLDAAARLGSPERELALARLDADVARTAAPWAAIASERLRDFFAERIGCQRYTPAMGIDLAELCIDRG